MNTISMKDIVTQNAPFENEYGVTADQYKPIDAILGKDIDVYAVKRFENGNGPGVFFLAKVHGGPALFYGCTHSVGIVGAFTRPEVADALEGGNVLTTRIIKRKSTKSDRMVYAIDFE